VARRRVGLAGRGRHAADPEGHGPAGIRRIEDVSLNLAVLGFTVAVAVGVGVVTGILPRANACSQNCESSSMASGERRRSPAHDRLRSAFVAAEVAISIILLIGAGLLTRSLSRVLANDRG
jgi:hypothetical protein